MPIVMSCKLEVNPPGPVHEYENPVGALHVVVLPVQTDAVPPEMLQVGGFVTVNPNAEEVLLLQDTTFGFKTTR